jgi:DNA-binding transcriptional MerR regulator
VQEILVSRALGFSLDEIGELLDEAGHDRLSALRTQRELVDSELARLAGLARALDRAIATVEHGDEQEEETMFDGFDPSQYEDEARKRWGDTDAYKESARRAASYREEQWREIKLRAQETVRLFRRAETLGPGTGQRAGAGRGRAGSPSHRPLVLPLLARHAPRDLRDVRRRPAVRGQLREGRAGADGLRSRRDRRERIGRSARVGQHARAPTAPAGADR